MEVHPLANMVPEMTNEEFTELVEDIQTNGLVQPIITFGGKILDGRHRFKACEKAGVTPTFSEYKGEAPAALVLSLNCKRRSLTQAQRSLLAADMLPELEKEAKAQGDKARSETQKQGRDRPAVSATSSERAANETRNQAGKAAGVGRTSVQQAKKLTTAAASGDVKAKAAVRDIKSGKIRNIGEATRKAGLAPKPTTSPKPKPKLEMENAMGFAALASATGDVKNGLLLITKACADGVYDADAELKMALFEYLDEVSDMVAGIRSLLNTDFDSAVQSLLNNEN